MAMRKAVSDFKSGLWLLLPLIILIPPLQLHAAPAVTKEMIASQHRIEKIDHYEFIKPLDTHLVYVRYITRYRDMEMDFGEGDKSDIRHNKVADLIHGIYKMEAGRLLPVWEGEGDSDGYLIEGNFSCMGGCIEDYMFSTFYADYLDNQHPEFCIKSTWTPYRGEYDLYKCFNVEKPGAPILDILASGSYIQKQQGNNLLLHTMCSGKSEAGPDECEMCYAYNDNSNGYEETACQTELSIDDYNAKGEALYRQKQYQQAYEYFLKAYKLDEDSEKTTGNLSITLIKLGRYDEAISYSQHMLDNERQLANENSVRFNIALAYEKSQRYQDAIYWYERIEASGSKSTMKERIESLAAKAMEQAESSPLPAFDGSSHYPVAFGPEGIAYRIANSGAVVVLKFVQSRLQKNLYDSLVIITKHNGKVTCSVSWADYYIVANLDFEINDYNLDGYPDVSKVAFDAAVKSRKTVMRQYWLYSPEKQKLEGPFKRQEITTSRRYEPILELDFNRQGFKALPQGMERLVHLEKLNLSGNKLEGIPLSVTGLPQLKNLEFGWGELKAIPAEINRLQKLEILNLNNNLIESLPAGLYQLKSLKSLYMYDNKLKEIPHEIAGLPQLEDLSLGMNQLNDIPKEIERLNKLDYLDLSYNKIGRIPEEVTSLSRLQSLDMASNEIATIPAAIAQLTQLRSLRLSNNLITEIPDELSEAKALRWLFLDGNRIQRLPDAIAGLKSLQILELNGNPIADEEKKRIQSLLPHTDIVF